MHVVYLVSSLKQTGLTKIIYNTARFLINNAQVSVIELNPVKENSKYKNELLNLGVKFYSVNLPKFKVMSTFRRVKEVLSDIKPDIVHAHCFRSMIYLSYMGSLSEIRRVCTLHSFVPENYRGEFGFIKGAFLSNFLLKHVKKLDARISVSKSVCDMLLKKCHLDTYPICNGVELPVDIKQDKDFIAENIFVYTGTVSFRKNIDFLCQAFSIFNSSDCTLIVVGDGNLLSELKQKYILSKNIIFVGRVDDVTPYLLTSKYLVSASRSEGLPNSVMEGMALGLPLLLSDIPQHLELLSGEENGFHFRLDDLDSLIDVIKKLNDLNSDAYKKLSSSSLMKIVKTYNVNEMSLKHLYFYESIL